MLRDLDKAPCLDVIRAYHMAQVESTFKDVRAKMFNSIDFFKLLVRIDNDLLVSEMH